MPDPDTEAPSHPQSRAESLARIGDIRSAIGLLTRLPVGLSQADMARGAAAAWAYPLAGLTVGVIGALTAFIGALCGLPPVMIAGLALSATIIVTGALHEDGLADSVDGLWGGWSPARRLDIMKDSHIGSYGVIALVLSIGLRWAALASLGSAAGSSPLGFAGLGLMIPALVLAATLSRAPIVVLMYALPHARSNGLSASVGRPGLATTSLAIAVCLVLGFALFGVLSLVVFVVLPLTTLTIGLIAARKINGQTGDVLGASQQVSEITILGVILALNA